MSIAAKGHVRLAVQQRMRKVWMKGGLLLLFVGTTASGLHCSDEPTGTNYPGSTLGGGSVVIKDTTIYATQSASYNKLQPMGPRNVFVRHGLLGSTNGFKASLLLQFDSSKVPSRDTIRVLSAKLSLRCVAWGGTPSGTWAFDGYKITSPWDVRTVRPDSLPTYDAARAVISYSGTVAQDTETVTLNVDTALVRRWFSNNTGDRYGLIFVPRVSSDVVRGIQGFIGDSTQYLPTLQVIAGNASGVVLDTTTFNIGVDTFVGNASSLPMDPLQLYVQAGLPYRSVVKFDVSFLKPGSIINSAELQLDRAPATRFWKFTTDSVLNMHVLRSATDTLSFDSYFAAGRKKEGTNAAFAFDARYAVQTWLRVPNYGVIIRHGDLNEYSTFNLFAFYNERAANGASRPRLVIKYTVSQY